MTQGLVARRIATALTKELKESEITLQDSYVPYLPKSYNVDGKQVQLVTGTIKDKVRVDGVGTLTGVESHIHQNSETDSQNSQV